MTFLETPRFPTDISAGSKFGPGYFTMIARNLGGFEASNKNWSMPLHRGDVIYGVKSQAQMEVVLAYFHGVAGMHNSFRFKNPNDNAATGSQGTVLALGNGTYQMYKTYTYGALTFARKISKPVSGAVIAGGGSYSTDTTTGIITALGSPTVAPTGWTGSFDTPVRFDVDQMLPESRNASIYVVSSLPIIEVRL